MQARAQDQVQQQVIDCDVHNAVPSVEALVPYLPDRWRDYMAESGVTTIEANYYPKGARLSARPGSRPESGPAGADLDLLREQLLDAWNVRYAILNCLYGVQLILNEEWAGAMPRAMNDWQVAEWLRPGPPPRGPVTGLAPHPPPPAPGIDPG